MSNLIVPVRGKKAAKSQKPMKTIKKKIAKKERKEMTKLGYLFRSLGSGAGALLGGYAGYPAQGAAVGTSLGAAISKWLGSGDYEIASNSILGVGPIPAMHKDGQSIILRHKEFVGEIKGSTTFAVQKTVNLNPGLAGSFPWLATVAQSFSEYRIRGMVFHYIPTSGASVAAANTALGSVMIQTTYRSSDSAPQTKLEMMNEYCANEIVPSETMCHPIECDPKENPFQIQYVRGGNIPSGDTSLLYDLGTTYVATSGQQTSGTVLGDVWVTYEVELKKPVVTSNVMAQDSYFIQGDTTASFVFAGIVGGSLKYSPGIVTTSLSNSCTFVAVPGRYYTYCITMVASTGGTHACGVIGDSFTGAVASNGPYGDRSSESVYCTAGYGTSLWRTIQATSTSVTLTFVPPTIDSGGYNRVTLTVASYQ